MVCAELAGMPESRLAVPLVPAHEYAVVLLAGDAQLDGQTLSPDTLYYLGRRRHELVLASGHRPVRALLLGGAPFGETVLMWWNFVARTTDEIIRHNPAQNEVFGTVCTNPKPTETTIGK